MIPHTRSLSRTAVAFSVAVLSILPTAQRSLADEKSPKTIQQWLEGKNRSEVVRAFGEPPKTLQRAGGTILIYKFRGDGTAFFPSKEPDPYALVREGEVGSGVADFVVDSALDLASTKNPRAYGMSDYAVQSDGSGCLRRIELRLNAQGVVESAKVKWAMEQRSKAERRK
jgi:hypothetical protein